MIRRIVLIVLFAIPFLTMKSFAQDPEFSQFYANPLYLNPALAGVTAEITPATTAAWTSASVGTYGAVSRGFAAMNASSVVTVLWAEVRIALRASSCS